VILEATAVEPAQLVVELAAETQVQRGETGIERGGGAQRDALVLGVGLDGERDPLTVDVEPRVVHVEIERVAHERLTGFEDAHARRARPRERPRVEVWLEHEVVVLGMRVPWKAMRIDVVHRCSRRLRPRRLRGP
jgi:hypothetical protein